MQLIKELRQEVVRENRHSSPDPLEKPQPTGPEDLDKVRDLNSAESKDSRKLAKEKEEFSALTQQTTLNAVAAHNNVGNDLRSAERVCETTHTLAAKSLDLETATSGHSTLERTDHSRTVEQTKGDLIGPGRFRAEALIRDLTLRTTQEPELRKPALEVTKSDFEAVKPGHQFSGKEPATRSNGTARGGLALGAVVGLVARELDHEL